MRIGLAVILILISSVFGAFSTLFFKLGSAFPINFKNKKLGLAVFLAGISFLLYLHALKLAPLTFIYLTASISYIWTVLLARIILQEQFNKFKIVGMGLVFLGIIILHI